MTALEELRESLRQAARRDVQAERARTRKRRRRTSGFVALALLGGAAAAGAADLISVGEPVRETRGKHAAKYRPAETERVQLALTARSGRKEPFGVGIYTSSNGERCAVAGQVRARSLGVVEGGKFRAYDPGVGGACRPGEREFQSSTDVAGRTLVFGRAPPGARVARIRGTDHASEIGLGGAFLFVYELVPPDTRFDVEYE